jgi:exopolysaccharide biosynthesis polyprenyl glycosylphosphotransferase
VNEVRRKFLLSFLKLFDVGLVILSFGLATVLSVKASRSIPLSDFLAMRIKLGNFVIFLLALLFAHVVFSMYGLYRSRRLSSRMMEIADCLKATTVSSVVFFVVGLVFNIRMITPQFLLAFWLILSVILVTSRVLMRVWLAEVRKHGRNLRYMLVLGTNARAIEFARKIQASPGRGYQILGFVDEEWPGIEQFNKTGFEVVCDYAGLAEFLRRNVIDEVAIYLPLRSFHEHSSHVAALCEEHGIGMRFATDIFGLRTSRARAEYFDGDYHIAAYPGVREEWPLVVKRTIDLAISFTLLVLLSPVFVVAAIAIRFTSKGPIFFRQERLGLNKRRFYIYKFRTMVPDAENLISTLEDMNEVSGPVFKIKDDPRITGIGKFLRRTSVDELPQLFNILKGEMSLVGPRPLPKRDYDGFSEDWQRRRFSVRPGITCLWQVNGRSSIPFEQWMRLDLQYMDEWSLWLDLKILARTIPAVLRGSGAV